MDGAQEVNMESADDEQDSESSASEDDKTDEPVSDCTEQSSCSDEESGEDAQETEGEEWTSRNGLIQWCPTNEKTLRYSPVKCPTPGPTRYAISRISCVQSAFELLITEEMIQLLVDKTNAQGRRVIKTWKDVDATDLRAYIGLLILVGVFKSRNESTHALWDGDNGRPIFRAAMSQKTFRMLNTCLRFDDRRTRQERQELDKLAPIRTMWDKWTERLPLLFYPGRDVCVDEQLVAFKGLCKFRQYMPRKPARYGIKIWVTCDVQTSYAWRMQIHTGKPADGPAELNQGGRVVLEMTEGMEGHTVTCDNFFTSYGLAKELLKNRIALVGTIRKGKRELPPKLLHSQHRPVLSSVFAFTKTHTAVSYVPKRRKNVVLLSTKHREPSVGNTDLKKPTIILDYNRCRGGVDTLDKVLGTYSVKRQTYRWPMVVFFNMIDVSAYNAFVLWKAVDSRNSKLIQRRLFLEELGKKLVAPRMMRRTHLPHAFASVSMVERIRQKAQMESDEEGISHPAKKRKLCGFCTGKRRKTAVTCTKCGVTICKDHSVIFCKSCKLRHCK